MRHTQVLQSSERWNVSTQGEYIHYEKGAGEIEIEVNGEIHLLAIRDTYMVKEGYVNFNVLNLDASAGEFVFRTGKGDLKVAASGQLTEVTGIASTVDVNVLNAVRIESLPTLEMATMPPVDVLTLPAVEKKDVSNVLTSSYSLAAGSVVTIPAKVGRKRLVLQAYTPSLNTTICRVSDSSKTSIEGQILAAGGGLLSELEHKHADALKVWNPSGEDAIEIITQEEF